MRVPLNTLKRGERFRLTYKPDAPLWKKWCMYDKWTAVIIKNGEDILDFGISRKAVKYNKMVYV